MEIEVLVEEERCDDLLRRVHGEIRWQVVSRSPNPKQIAELLKSAFRQQGSIDAVLLGSEVFWRVIVAPPQLKCLSKMRHVVSALEDSVEDFALSLGRVNASLSGIGRIERSPYVVVEDAVTVAALDFFRGHGCDLDWVKRQLYGERLLYVPETFPEDIPTPHV